ncbi:hypothetical protein JG687_00007070 [Phytophthora cactorum]|uniref:Uncharacterized protein n=1 Tax=Phytophthora cactorum TaxID=29920 RepID=A0A329SQM1_9STRA|nr:hypothetical protein Pcac1_g3976 [Phytophthora cactorum]KAG2818852.1 hypothetical protein PC112_g12441 [Phytophthora cactorum]KAG2820948.1 hypothetical protein PC111_g11237 [Phytophthora cactorum]KAG2854908.1 hypothetical protein PC113_g12911 [Phytophthora cactorum]KAG2900419.1 hypothetical protein PC114_g13563 [Phytophthora cactorum]
MAGASPKKNGSAPQTPKQSPPRSSPSPSPSRGPDDVDADELTALIKAIKFAHPEFGVKRVHDQVLSHGGKFARVPFKRVKRYMHKLGMNSPSEEDKTPVKLMTVGGDSKSLREGGPEASGATDDMVWLPVKLDEPASKLQEFPYQAVIRMTTNEDGDAEGSLGEIYKIQVAMEADGSLSTIHPMLVYNKARSRKTFLHPDSPAYLPVQRLVTAQGQKGAVGGSKAYFWGRYFKIEDMLYINTEKIAPAQQW